MMSGHVALAKEGLLGTAVSCVSVSHTCSYTEFRRIKRNGHG